MQSSPTEGQEESWPAPPGELIHALAQCSALIHAPHDWTESVDAMLATIGRVTRASRAWIFQVVEITETDILQDYIFEWAASPSVVQLNLTRFRLFRTSLRPPDYRALVEGRQRGEHTAFLTRDLPPGHLRDDMNSQAITAMMTVPIMLDRTWWGTLGLDDCVREVPWSSEELYFLRTCADLIGALIHRQRLDDRTRQLAVLDASVHSGVWDWAFDPGRLWCSDAFYRLLGYPPPYPKLSLRGLLRHIAPEHRDALMERIRRCIAGTSDDFRLDMLVRTRSGVPVWWEVRADVGRGSDGRLKRIAGLALEITSRKLAEDSLRDAADTDPLTGALNRRGLEAVADRCIAATEEPETLHLLALDIDHFKAVNDTYGHPAGDVALRAVADRVAAHLREGDWLARVGGEEFAVLLHGGPRVAEVVAERIRVGVAAEPVDCLEAGGPLGGLTLTVSLGVATFIPGETLHAALRRADAALYAAKRGGRNRVVRAEDLAHVGAA